MIINYIGRKMINRWIDKRRLVMMVLQIMTKIMIRTRQIIRKIKKMSYILMTVRAINMVTRNMEPNNKLKQSINIYIQVNPSFGTPCFYLVVILI